MGRKLWTRRLSVIWLGRRRVRKPKRAGRPVRWPSHRPGSSLVWYTASLGVAVAVMWKAAPPASSALPVTGPVARLHRPSLPSWLDRALGGLSVSKNSLKDWMTEAVPVLDMSRRPSVLPLKWRALAMTGLMEVTGVRLTSLPALLTLEMPTLTVVPAAVPPSAPVSSPPLTRLENGLPGDGGRVWAELGRAPRVGIYQTHSHESFWPELGRTATTAYTTDWSKSIVEVGWWLAQDLHQDGVSVVQSRVDNMNRGILASYNQSYATAQQLLKWYPTVNVLLDIHRGQAAGSETTAEIGGRPTARIRIVVGTDKLLPDPHWRQNLAYARRLAAALGRVAPGIVRQSGIVTVPYRYNQQLMAHDLLIEIGGPDNTLGEERRAAGYLARAIARLCGTACQG